MGLEFVTESLLFQMTCFFFFFHSDPGPVPLTVVECDEPVKWRVHPYSGCGQMYALVFLPLILCEKAKAVSSQLR